MLDQVKSSVLSLQRRLEGGLAHARIECLPSQITILADENGGRLEHYAKALKGEGSQSQVQVALGQQSYQADQLAALGFDERLPEQITISQYLKDLNYTASEVENMLDTLELRKINYLHCAQLPATAQRQLAILGLLRKPCSVWLLNDPFQPFSGRWREHFAEILLKTAVESEIYMICLNVSFMPKCWEKSDCVKQVDVGHLEDSLIQQAIRIRDAEKIEKKENREKLAETNIQKSLEPKKPVAKFIVPIPENLACAYHEMTDYIFEPLARWSNYFRRFGLITGVFGFAGLLALMSVVMFPNLAPKWLKMREMASHFNYTLRDFIPTQTQDLPKLVPEHDSNVDQPQNHNPDSETLENEQPLEEWPINRVQHVE